MLPWVFPDGITSSCLVLDLANYFCLSLPQKHRSTPCTLAPPLQLSCFLELASNISLCYIQNNNVSGIQSFIHLCCIQSFFFSFLFLRQSLLMPAWNSLCRLCRLPLPPKCTIKRVFVLLLFFETESLMAQAGSQLSKQLRMTLNLSFLLLFCYCCLFFFFGDRVVSFCNPD